MSATLDRPGFVVVPGAGPKKGPRNGDTSRCAHDGCPIVVRFKNGAWVHAIRNRSYDHAPEPATT